MTLTQDMTIVALPSARQVARAIVQGVAGLAVLSAVAYSAVLAKEARTPPVLAEIEVVPTSTGSVLGADAPAEDFAAASTFAEANTPANASFIRTGFSFSLPGSAWAMGLTSNAQWPDSDSDKIVNVSNDAAIGMEGTEPAVAAPRVINNPYASDARVRWFDGRPIRPVRQMWMTVTGYSPDARSCGESADGLTATMHSVFTNGERLVAADPTVLNFGSMITVPGYDTDLVVPVLDCGGAIKGRRLDLLFPTHEQARNWGVKRLLVTVWGFADGKPGENPRKLR